MDHCMERRAATLLVARWREALAQGDRAGASMVAGALLDLAPMVALSRLLAEWEPTDSAQEGPRGHAAGKLPRRTLRAATGVLEGIQGTRPRGVETQGLWRQGFKRRLWSWPSI